MSVSLFQFSNWLKKKLINSKYFVYFASRTHEKSVVKRKFFRNILGSIMRFLISIILYIINKSPDIDPKICHNPWKFKYFVIFLNFIAYG